MTYSWLVLGFREDTLRVLCLIHVGAGLLSRTSVSKTPLTLQHLEGKWCLTPWCWQWSCDVKGVWMIACLVRMTGHGRRPYRDRSIGSAVSIGWSFVHIAPAPGDRNIMVVFSFVSCNHSSQILWCSLYMFPHRTTNRCAFVVAPANHKIVTIKKPSG